MKTLEMLLREGTEILETAEIGEARLDAWLLLEYITGKNRAYYYAHMDQEAEEDQEKTYLTLCRKRAEHIPLQHLTGTACFMGYDFYVDERVLAKAGHRDSGGRGAEPSEKNREAAYS